MTEHPSSRQETADLLSVIDRDLHDCQTPGLSADWRLNIAYNAALAAEGYRTTRESHHHRAIQSLTDTLGTDGRTIAQLDALRKKRNISDYERAGSVSDVEAAEMASLATKLREDLLRWLRSEHPKLLPESS
ncbi:MAG: hypothetical protein HQ567_21755 [Candidatus Nealsonbacteria bacterium]|nr:hypothetical protein [Candidatus Nealsonbacteria bacterium]